MNQEDIARCIEIYKQHRSEIRYFVESVVSWLNQCDSAHRTGLPDVYAIKSRLKDEGHLAEKLARKQGITPETFLGRVNDLGGVRVLHLWPSQFAAIHAHILKRIGNDWVFYENPKAYTWDPETQKYFEGLGLPVEMKESYYTSVHYIVKPNNPSALVTCEIQVRSLLEEVWGEIDHSINYPDKTTVAACSDQLLVLAKLVGAGSRLITSIESSHAAAS